MSPTKGQVQIEIKAKDQASAKMAKIGKSTEGMSRKFKMASLAIAAMGVALVVAVGKMVNSYATAGDEVAKMAKRTGWGVEALSEMRHIAKIAGTEIGSLEKAIKKMGKTILDASRGLETYVRSFEELGLSVEDLERMSPEDVFWEIAYAIGRIEDPTKKAAYAMEIFGRAGTDLLPMLAMTREEMEREKQAAHDLGLVFTEEAAAKCEEFKDSTERLKGALTGLSNEIASTVMPQLTELAETLTEDLKPAIAWLSEHPEVTEAFLKFGTVIGGVMVVGMLSKFINAVTLIIGLFVAWNAWILTLEERIKRFMVVFAPLAAVIESIGKLKGMFWPTEVTPEIPPVEEWPIRPHKKGGIITKPTMALLGEGGPEAIIPFSRGMTALHHTSNINIHIHGDFMGDELSLRELGRKLQEIMREEERRTAFSGINTGYFYGGSHI